MTDTTEATPVSTAVVQNSHERPIRDNVVQEPVADKPRAEDGKYAGKDKPAEAVTDPGDQNNPATQSEDKKPNRTKEFIERIKKENRELRESLASIEARLPKPEEPKPPSPDEYYQDPSGWTQRNTQYELQKARKEWEAELSENQRRQSDQANLERWASRIEELSSVHPDIQETLDAIPPQLLSQDFARAIIGHERGAELAYLLAQNPVELVAVTRLDADSIRWTLDKMVSRLTATPSEAPTPTVVAPVKAVTRAPAPVTTLSGSPVVKKSYAQMSQKEYEIARKAERRAKGLRD